MISAGEVRRAASAYYSNRLRGAEAVRAHKSHALSNDPSEASGVVPCRLDHQWTRSLAYLAVCSPMATICTSLFHVLITRGDTRRCTKKRSAARSCGPAIRAIESLWKREERGLCVSESARASEACMCVCARQQRYQRWYNSLNTQCNLGRCCGIIYHCSHFFRSLASTCVNSRKPRAPHHRPTPAGTDNRTDTHR